jgi:hypothetical protein
MRTRRIYVASGDKPPMQKPRPGMTVEETRDYNRAKAQEQRKRDPEYYRRWKAEHPERNRNYHRRYRYGISHEDFLTLFEKQGGKCACCGTALVLDLPKRDPQRTTSVDHDHETGKIRGLLCNGCNAGLGHFEDSVQRLEQAVAYIRRHTGESPA